MILVARSRSCQGLLACLSMYSASIQYLQQTSCKKRATQQLAYCPSHLDLFPPPVDPRRLGFRADMSQRAFNPQKNYPSAETRQRDRRPGFPFFASGSCRSSLRSIKPSVAWPAAQHNEIHVLLKEKQHSPYGGSFYQTIEFRDRIGNKGVSTMVCKKSRFAVIPGLLCETTSSPHAGPG